MSPVEPRSIRPEPLEEFIAYGDALDPDIGPMFGRDAARVGRALKAIIEFPLDESKSANWHFAEVRLIAREALNA